MKIPTLKGVDEYLPKNQIIREKIKQILMKNFKKYGYGPVETSILEMYDIAANKYAGGEEILKETYKLTDQGNRNLALRYELTFKLGKLIALNPTMRMPFKRYEIGKVFRDGPVKKGRLREFTQCDIDCVGVKGVYGDAEFMPLIFDVFNDMELPVFVQVNNRKLLFGMFENFGIKEDKFISAALSIDKIVKYGTETVKKEMIEKGFGKNIVENLIKFLKEAETKKTNKELIEFFKEKLGNDLAEQGIKEIEEFFSYCDSYELIEDIILVPSLSRGLGYYTGMMWEVYAKDSKIKSSIAAGGRWDKMIGEFLQSKQEYPATGMSFGLDVIYTALEGKKIPGCVKVPCVYLIPLNTVNECMTIASVLRSEGISVDIAYEKKLGKAMDYANKEEIPYVVVVGEEEVNKKVYNLKDMKTGVEELLKLEEVAEKLCENQINK